MMRKQFDEELKQLNNDLLKMGLLVEETLEQTKVTFKTKNQELAKQIIDNDRRINDLEKTIENLCFSLMLRQQPVASDLRTITTALKVVTDLERIGDQCSDICEILLKIHDEYPYKTVEHIPLMVNTCRQMVNEVITAYVEKDLEKGQHANSLDDKVDHYFHEVKEEIIQIIKENNEGIDYVLDYLMIGKYLERIGDHATNIYEWLKFLETGHFEL